jgi:hypothetical protein
MRREKSCVAQDDQRVRGVMFKNKVLGDVTPQESNCWLISGRDDSRAETVGV